MKKKFIIIPVVILIALILFSMCTFKVGEKQFVVARQFGKIISTTEEPGLHIKSPLYSMTHISASKHMYDIKPSEIITADKKTMLVDAYVLWEVTDPIRYIQSLNASEKTAEGRIDILVYNAIKTVCSYTTQETLIASRDGHLEATDEAGELMIKNVNLSDKFLKQLNDQDAAYGIKISAINIKVLDMPDENKNAVYNRMISERENIAASYTAQGESEAKIIRNTTDKEIAIILSEAEAEAEKIVAQGEAKYMSILSDAYNDKSKADFYLFRRSLDAAKASLVGGNKTLFLDANNPLVSIFAGE